MLSSIASNLVLLQQPKQPSLSHNDELLRHYQLHSPSGAASPQSSPTPTHNRSRSVDAVLAELNESRLGHSRFKPPAVLSNNVSPNGMEHLWRTVRKLDTYIKLLSIEQLLFNPLRTPAVAEWDAFRMALSHSMVQLGALLTLLADGTRRYSDHTMMRFWRFAIHDMMRDLAAVGATLARLSIRLSGDPNNPGLKKWEGLCARMCVCVFNFFVYRALCSLVARRYGCSLSNCFRRRARKLAISFHEGI